MMEFGERQVELLNALSFKNYVGEIFAHCEAMYPALVSSQSKGIFCSYIEQSITLAKQSGFTQRGPVQLYIDVMIILGLGFGDDPQHQWLKLEQLNGFSTQLEKSMVLYAKLRKYLDAVYGDNGVFYDQSVERLKRISVQNIFINQDSYHTEVHKLLSYVYPQRYDFLGYNTVNDLILLSDGYSKQNEIKRSNHKAYLTLVMFLFGVSFNENYFRNNLGFGFLLDYFSTPENNGHDFVVSCYSCLKVNA